MSKLKDSYIDEEPNLTEYEMKVLDDKYLKEIVDVHFPGKPTALQISAYFGSFDEFINALSKMSHPMHKEAMIVKKLRKERFFNPEFERNVNYPNVSMNEMNNYLGL